MVFRRTAWARPLFMKAGGRVFHMKNAPIARFDGLCCYRKKSVRRGWQRRHGGAQSAFFAASGGGAAVLASGLRICRRFRVYGPAVFRFFFRLFAYAHACHQFQSDCHLAHLLLRDAGLRLCVGRAAARVDDAAGAGRDCGRPGRSGQRADGARAKHRADGAGLFFFFAAGADDAGHGAAVYRDDDGAHFPVHGAGRAGAALPHHCLWRAGGGHLHHAGLCAADALVSEPAADFVRHAALQQRHAVPARGLSAPARARQHGRRFCRAGRVFRRQSRFFRPRRGRVAGRRPAPGVGAAEHGGDQRLQPVPQRLVLPHARPAPASAHGAHAAAVFHCARRA